MSLSACAIMLFIIGSIIFIIWSLCVSCSSSSAFADLLASSARAGEAHHKSATPIMRQTDMFFMMRLYATRHENASGHSPHYAASTVYSGLNSGR